MAAVARSIELLYISGRPDGMLTAKMFNWSGQLLVAPRAQLVDALARPEADYTGIYLLTGEQAGEPLAYIGESESVGGRIRGHDAAKDWWSNVVLVTTTANELNKAHVRYLEARLIQQAKKVGRIPLTNGTAPSLPGLSEADIHKMEVFLENLYLVLPAVRVDLFIERARPKVDIATSTHTDASDQFGLTLKKYGIRATAVAKDGEFIVEAGSTARADWEGVGPDTRGFLHKELRRAGVLQPQGPNSVFTQNYAFRSPSAAASVVMGRSANGQTEWRTETGQSYKDWEEAHLKTKHVASVE